MEFEPADSPRGRHAPLDMDPDAFRRAGHALVDRVADHLAELRGLPVSPGEQPGAVRAALGGGGLPRDGEPVDALIEDAARLLFEHSTFNGHPRFWGYITASAAPVGVLGELLAAGVNANVGGWALGPMATEIEAQTIRWIAELVGYPADCGGLLVSGGNMANFVGFLAGRRAKLTWDARTDGLAAGTARPRVYASVETHTWIDKAADLFGLGLDAIRSIPTDAEKRMDVDALRDRIREDALKGDLPMLVVGTAGSVSTGAVDPLPAIADVCREHGLWFHVDGAYGAFAACSDEAPAELRALALADSVALDPHKWLYTPLEAGCALVRDREALRSTFSFEPPTYYRFTEEEPAVNFYEYGPQNSRGFRALKIWLALRAVGRDGYERMISDDIRLAREMHRRAGEHPELEALTHALSIATFRFVPPDLDRAADDADDYLDRLNAEILTRIQRGGEAFVSNAVVAGRFALRACIVNFRTTLDDVAALPDLVARTGRDADREMRPAGLARGGS